MFSGKSSTLVKHNIDNKDPDNLTLKITPIKKYQQCPSMLTYHHPYLLSP
jgi:hypothetical protein